MSRLRVTYIRSAIGRSYRQKRTIRALGFTKLNQTRLLPSNPSIWGMIEKVRHLLKVELVPDPTTSDPNEARPLTRAESHPEGARNAT